MTVSSIKVKIVRKPSLKLKVLPRFPANVIAQNFLTVTRTGGTYTFSVDYTVLPPGPIIDPATAIVAILDQTAGVYKEVSLASLLTSGLDADLQAIAALTGTGILARTADGTWALRTLTAPAAGITITNPAGIAGNPTLVLANDLAAVEGLAANGIATRTATDTWAVRTITAGASIGVTNGDGVSGNPTIAVTDAELVALAGLTSAADQLPYFTGSGTAALTTLTTFARTLIDDTTQAAMRTTLGLTPGTDVQAFDSDLAALAANAGTGLWSVTGAGTGSVRTITGPAAGITVTNGGGVAGNPTLALANDLAALEGLASTGIARRTATDTWSVGTLVSNAELATAGAATLKGNPTNATAGVIDFTIQGLTARGAPDAANDKIPIYDNAAGTIKYVTPSQVAGASSGTVTSVAADGGAVTGTGSAFTTSGTVYVQQSIPGGRLTLTSATPVTTTDVVAATVVYYAPISNGPGGFVPIYNGTIMRQYPFISSATDAVGLSVTLGSNWTTATNYDWFIALNAGVVTLGSGPAWSVSTGTGTDARGTGAGTTELQLYNGIWTNKNSITLRYANGSTFTAAANQATFVGTFRTVAAGQAEDSMAKRFVYNQYNQAQRVLKSATETTPSWNYTTTQWRQANANTANQLDCVVGLAGSLLDAKVTLQGDSSAGTSFAAVSIGINSTTVPSAQEQQTAQGNGAVTGNARLALSAVLQTYPAIGRQFFPWIEAAGIAAGTNTYYGQNTVNGILYQQAGISGTMLM